MRVTAKVNIELAKSTNYLILGDWSDMIQYVLSDAGIPVVRVPDSTSLGYSVYALSVEASTVGASPSGAGASEWRLVESAEFIYMQQAYIERLQAALVTAEKIESIMIRTKNLEVKDGAKIGAWNVDNDSLGIDVETTRYVDPLTQQAYVNIKGFSLYMNPVDGAVYAIMRGNTRDTYTQLSPLGLYATLAAQLSRKGYVGILGSIDAAPTGVPDPTIAVAGVKKDASRSFDNFYGGWFEELMIEGMYLRTLRVSYDYIMSDTDVKIVSTSSSGISVYLPSNPRTGRTVYITRQGSGSVNIRGNGKVINRGVGTHQDYSGLGQGDTAMLTFDGAYWTFNYFARYS